MSTQNYPTAGPDWFVPGVQFEAGVGSFGFVSPFLDPLQNFIGGGTEFHKTIRATQPKPVYIPNPLGLLTGFDNPLGEMQSEVMTEVY